MIAPRLLTGGVPTPRLPDTAAYNMVAAYEQLAESAQLCLRWSFLSIVPQRHMSPSVGRVDAYRGDEVAANTARNGSPAEHERVDRNGIGWFQMQQRNRGDRQHSESDLGALEVCRLAPSDSDKILFLEPGRWQPDFGVVSFSINHHTVANFCPLLELR